MVHRMFDDLNHLHDPAVKAKKLEAAVGVKSVWGLFSLNYRWNWFELEKQEATISEDIIRVAKLMRPYYEALLDAYRRPLTSRARGKGGSGS